MEGKNITVKSNVDENKKINVKVFTREKMELKSIRLLEDMKLDIARNYVTKVLKGKLLIVE